MGIDDNRGPLGVDRIRSERLVEQIRVKVVSVAQVNRTRPDISAAELCKFDLMVDQLQE